MICIDKLDAALHSINRVMIAARSIAFERGDYQDIAKLMDYAEDLPRLISWKENMTERFHQNLQEMARLWPQCQSALDVFEKPTESRW